MNEKTETIANLLNHSKMFKSVLSIFFIAYSLAISPSSSIIEVSNQISTNVVRNMTLSIRKFQNQTENEIVAAQKSIKFVHDKFGFYCSAGLSEAVYAFNRSGSTTQISLMSATIGVIQFLEIVLANLTISSGFETGSRKKITKR